MNILIVDDQPLVLKSLQYTFDRMGHQTSAAVDGMQAKEMYAKHKPAVAIVDLMLPFVTGLELIEYIRETEEQYTWILVLSGLGSQNTIQQAFDLGIDDYIRKPFMPVDLISRVNRLERYQNNFQSKLTNIKN